MPKAVLVIDMPESINGETPCKHCSLHVAEYDNYYHHYVCQSIRTNISADEWEIYKKCPLKSLPKKKYSIPFPSAAPQLCEGMTESENDEGWNACIDELTDSKSSSEGSWEELQKDAERWRRHWLWTEEGWK